MRRGPGSAVALCACLFLGCSDDEAGQPDTEAGGTTASAESTAALGDPCRSGTQVGNPRARCDDFLAAPPTPSPCASGADRVEVADGDALALALGAACEGLTVVLRPGANYRGCFRVSPGVRLVSEADARAVISGADEAEPALCVAGGADRPTVLRDLEVRHAGLGVRAGRGSVDVRGVTVRPTRVGGLLATDLDALTLRDVSVPVDGLEQAMPDLEGPDPARHPVFGVALRAVAILDAANVEVSGVAGFGVVALDAGAGELADVRVHDHVGAGVHVEGGALTLRDARVSAEAPWLGAAGEAPISVGVAATGGAALTTVGLRVEDTVGIGLLHDDSGGTHAGLSVTDTGFAGVWVQHNAARAVGLTDARLERTSGAGLVALESGAISLSEVIIAAAARLRRPDGDDIADGLHIIRPVGGLSLDAVDIAGAGPDAGLLRAGILVETPEALAAADAGSLFALDGVQIRDATHGSAVQGDAVAESQDAIRDVLGAGTVLERVGDPPERRLAVLVDRAILPRLEPVALADPSAVRGGEPMAPE